MTPAQTLKWEKMKNTSRPTYPIYVYLVYVFFHFFFANQFEMAFFLPPRNHHHHSTSLSLSLSLYIMCLCHLLHIHTVNRILLLWCVISRFFSSYPSFNTNYGWRFSSSLSMFVKRYNTFSLSHHHHHSGSHIQKKTKTILACVCV